MSDIKVNQELSKLNQKKCKFCNQLDYIKPECKVKKGIATIEIKSKDSMEEEEEPKLINAKENQ